MTDKQDERRHGDVPEGSQGHAVDEATGKRVAIIIPYDIPPAPLPGDVVQPAPLPGDKVQPTGPTNGIVRT